jgi:hypothetical protein
MSSIRTRMVASIIVCISLASTASATGAAQATAQAASSESKRSDYVENTGFKNKVFEIKNRDPRTLVGVISALGSGFRGAVVQYNEEFRTITVRDFPENLAVIEEAIKRLDAPEAPRPTIEFHIHVLIASSDEAPGSDYPPEISDALKQLQSTLRYKSYKLMSSSIQRAKEGFPGVNNSGVAESKLLGVETAAERPILYSYSLRPVMVESSGTSSTTVQIGSFSFQMKIPLNVGGAFQYQSVGFDTPVSLHDGEKVVVGTTTMGNKGVVVLLLARLIK